MSSTAGRKPVALAPLGRLAVVTTCAALGLHPDALVPGAVLIVGRVRIAAVAAWRHVRLSWRPLGHDRRV